jgi:WD40 repeat protein
VTSLSFSPNGEHIATTGGELLNFNRVVDGALLWTKRLPHGVRAVAYSPDGAQIAVVGNRPMMLASSNGSALWTNQTIFFSLSTAFSPDGRYVAADSVERIGSSEIFSAKLLNAINGQVVRSFPGHNSYVQSVAFSPNGHLLATGSWDGTARLWNVDAGTPLRTINVTDTNVSSVAFSPDGKHLIVGSYDAMARIYRVDNGQLLLELSGHNDRVTTVAFSPAGNHALTASEDGAVLLWSLGALIPIDLALKITTQSGNIRISWTGEGELQAAPAVTGPYEKVSGATNPMTIIPIETQFFRSHRPPASLPNAALAP